MSEIDELKKRKGKEQAPGDGSKDETWHEKGGWKGTGHDEFANDDWKWEGKFGKEGDGGRCWEGRRNDRRNEMLARGVEQNTRWKDVKT